MRSLAPPGHLAADPPRRRNVRRAVVAEKKDLRKEAERTPRLQEEVERLGAELAAADSVADWADLLPDEKEHYLGAAIELIQEEQAGERRVWESSRHRGGLPHPPAGRRER
jgi:hypothetical protein